MSTILRDLKYAFRMLTKTPGLSAIAIMTIALGVGLTTHTFSIVYGSVIRGLPYEGSDRLMYLTQAKLADGSTDRSVPVHDYIDWRDQQTTFEELGALYNGTVNLADVDQRPERFLGSFVTWNALGQSGAQPILGRGFQPGEDSPDAPLTIILGYDVWQNRYDADPGILGKTIRANGQMHTIIGVMPRGFKFPFDSYVWLPLGIDAAQVERGQGFTLEVFGRIKSDVSVDRAEAEIAAITQRLAEEYPVTNEGITSEMKPFTEEYMPAQIIAVMWAMLVAVFGVLLIACANVANLLLARAATRSKEVAVRTALGAKRSSVIRQLLMESLVVAVIGGVVGVGLSYVGINAFNAWIIDVQKPFWIVIGLFPQVLVFAIAITLLASVVAGTYPAFKASDGGVSEILKDGSRGSSLRVSKFSTGLVVGEIAVSCGLLIAAGFMVKSIVNVRNLDRGFVVENVLTARVGLNEIDYPDGEQWRLFHEQLLVELASLPGAQTVALTSNLPMNGAGQNWYGVERETYVTDRDYPFANQSVVTPEYFGVFGVTVTEGRGLTDQDRASNIPVAVVNESFARRHFSDGSAIGERIRFGRSTSAQPWLSIVGVVPDMYVGGGVGGIGSDDRDQHHIYIPLAQNPRRFMSVAIKASGDPLGMAPLVRDVVTGMDQNLPIYDVDSMEGVIESNTWAFSVFGSLFAMFGVIALFMSAVGLYGVMAFSVARRTQEMGIRMAMGAKASDIVSLVLNKGGKQLAVGIVIGLALGFGLSSPLRFVLFDVNTSDMTVYGAIVFTLGFAGILACFIPARRATRIDLVEALRPE